MKIIPAIDLIDGKCVRLTKGDYTTKIVYANNPLEMAQKFEEKGFTNLHLVDLDGAKKGAVVNLKSLELICKNTNLDVDFGGGVKTEKELISVFNSGATQVTIGSLAVKNKAEFQKWIDKYGAEKFILGADVKNRKISVNGWLETSDLDLLDFINSYYELGIRAVLCTDIAKDGMLNGTSIELYKEIVLNFPEINLIASGGVSCMQDIIDLDSSNIPSVVVGKAIYENRIDINELASYNKQIN